MRKNRLLAVMITTGLIMVGQIGVAAIAQAGNGNSGGPCGTVSSSGAGCTIAVPALQGGGSWTCGGGFGGACVYTPPGGAVGAIYAPCKGGGVYGGGGGVGSSGSGISGAGSRGGAQCSSYDTYNHSGTGASVGCAPPVPGSPNGPGDDEGSLSSGAIQGIAGPCGPVPPPITTTTTTPPAVSVSLTANPGTLPVGSATTLTAHGTNMKGNQSIVIADTTTGVIVASCAAGVSDCVTSYTSNTAGVQVFKASVSNASASVGVTWTAAATTTTVPAATTTTTTVPPTTTTVVPPTTVPPTTTTVPPITVPPGPAHIPT